MTEATPEVPIVTDSEDVIEASSPVVATNNADASGLPDSTAASEMIFYQTFEKENAIYNRLSNGFRYLKEARSGAEKKPMSVISPRTATEAAQAASGVGDLANKVTVNFIDPTTKKADTPKSTNMMSQQQQQQQELMVNVYRKLTTVFEQEYSSTLRSVQYKHWRSGEPDIISRLPLSTILQGSGAVADVAWGGAAGMARMSDPSEWHQGSMCHVYIAACASLEQYKSKIKPSLQAFVSQIENASASGGSNSAHYLIVYVPSGSGSRSTSRSAPSSNTTGGTPGSKEGGDDDSQTTASSGPVRRALANRFQLARRKIADYRAGEGEMDQSTHSQDSLGSHRISGPEAEDDAIAAAMNLLNKEEQTLYKTITNDFLKGKVCVLTPPSLDATDEANDDADAFVGRSQEWNLFNRMLGAVVVNGFHDRCRRYDDELRRLDAQRAAVASKNAKKGTKKSPAAVFNLSYFFLVKESLAFTFEQMCLPSEALMQYDEFRAFLPELTALESSKAQRARRKSKALNDDEGPSLVALADHGDSTNFRKRIRSEVDVTPIVDIMKRYLFIREISLLFQMEDPSEVVTRCDLFSKLMYTVMMRDIEDMTSEEKRERDVHAMKWVIQFSWDVKTTCMRFLTTAVEDEKICDTASVTTPRSDDGPDSDPLDHGLAASLSQMLETSRLLLRKLGDTEISTGNPMNKYKHSLAHGMQEAWPAWTPLEEIRKETEASEVEGSEAEVSDPSLSSPKKTRQDNNQREFLLTEAFASGSVFEERYLELGGVVVSLSRRGNKKRLASRIQCDIAEHHMRKGELSSAAAVLKLSVKQYKWDHWDRCHFYQLFRLAHCQRTTARPTDYLKTLVTCFTPRTAAAAPGGALLALQDDLDAIIGHASVGAAKYGRLSFIETDIKIIDNSSTGAAVDSGVDEKQVIKRYCEAGDILNITITVTSYLPRVITLDSIKLFILGFTEFSSIIENRESIEEDDAFNIVGTDSVLQVQPGRNTFNVVWKPVCAGQFILSTLEIKWKEGFFYYDSMDLMAPLLGIVVLPTEPTHSLKVEPECVVPGHDQEVRLEFCAGSDRIISGKVTFSCADNLTMIAPGETPADGTWRSNFELDLEPCQPGETVKLSTYVRSTGIVKGTATLATDTDVNRGLEMKVDTSYLHGTTEMENVATAIHMKNTLEYHVPLLSKGALSIESAEFLWRTGDDKAWLALDVMSNTPVRVSILGWSLTLPTELELDQDVNSDFKDEIVSVGDRIGFSFLCKVTSTSGDAAAAQEGWCLQLHLQDDNKKTFSITLPFAVPDFETDGKNYSLQKSPNEIKAVLSLEHREGTVGKPIAMKFSAELEDSQVSGKTLTYTIQEEECDWLLGGKTGGKLDSSGVVQIVGIPAVPGVLTRFPEFSIGIVLPDGTIEQQRVILQRPESFLSNAHTNISGVALPVQHTQVFV